jgi:hypothetical protein
VATRDSVWVFDRYATPYRPDLTPTSTSRPDSQSSQGKLQGAGKRKTSPGSGNRLLAKYPQRANAEDADFGRRCANSAVATHLASTEPNRRCHPFVAE